MKRLASCLLVALVIALPCHARQVTVIFRVDDYSAATNTDVERGMFEVFEKANVPLTVAVVPRVVENMYGQADGAIPGRELELPQDKIDLLRDYVARGVVEAALHGYSHELTSAPGSPRSEVAGLSEAEQTRRIGEGKRLLAEAAGMDIVTFIPPFNGYDETTVKVLQREGFTTLSAGLWCPAAASQKLRFLPSTSTLADCRAAVQAARESRAMEPTVVVLFHETDIVEAFDSGSMTLSQIAELLQWVNDQDDVRTMTASAAARAMPQYDSLRFAKWTLLRDRPTKLDRRFLPHSAWGVNEALWAAPGKPWLHIPSEADLEARWWQLRGAISAFWLAVTIAWCAAACVMLKVSHRAAAFAMLALLAGGWALWARGQFVPCQMLYLATGVIGAGLPLVIAMFTTHPAPQTQCPSASHSDPCTT